MVADEPSRVRATLRLRRAAAPVAQARESKPAADDAAAEDARAGAGAPQGAHAASAKLVVRASTAGAEDRTSLFWLVRLEWIRTIGAELG